LTLPPHEYEEIRRRVRDALPEIYLMLPSIEAALATGLLSEDEMRDLILDELVRRTFGDDT
jgi:hypothetical protein